MALHLLALALWLQSDPVPTLCPPSHQALYALTLSLPPFCPPTAFRVQPGKPSPTQPFCPSREWWQFQLLSVMQSWRPVLVVFPE